MLVLVVESATDTAAVALADEDGPIGSVVSARGRRHTETIAPAIETLCRRVGVALTDLDALGVDVGPGLFTGLRVGVGTVKALSFALDLPVVTATSLEVLASALAGSGAADGRLLVPVVDARRGEVFSARFRVEGTAAVPADEMAADEMAADEMPDRPSEAERLWRPEELAADLARLSDSSDPRDGSRDGLLLMGDGARRYAALFAPVAGVTLAGPLYAAPPVAALAELCVARARAGLLADGDEVMPRYLRQADATINWGQRVAPRVTTAGSGQ
jgi:tRNA threonylcarbamoyladenosine biosynthesis protein TsaB